VAKSLKKQLQGHQLTTLADGKQLSTNLNSPTLSTFDELMLVWWPKLKSTTVK
jgi:hypothetical protein